MIIWKIGLKAKKWWILAKLKLNYKIYKIYFLNIFMKKTIKKSFLWWIVFLGTLFLWFTWFAIISGYTDLPHQNNWDTLNSSIWNELIDKVNSIWTDINTLSWQINTSSCWNTYLKTTSCRSSYSTTAITACTVQICNNCWCGWLSDTTWITNWQMLFWVHWY